MAVSRIHSSNARIYLGTTGLKGITKYDFSFDQEVTTLQGLGDYHISNRIKNPNQKIDFSLSWILATGSNDPFYDFRNSNSGFISVQKFDFTIKDLAGSNFISGAYLTSYSVSASVGNLVEGSLKYEADGLFYSTGDNLLITDQTSDSYSPLLPSNIDVSFSGSANTVSLSGFAIQSFSFEIPIQRKPITLLGQTVPSYRYPQLPITAPIRFSVVKNQVTGINFSNLILPTGSIVFGLKDCRLNGYTYSFNNASLKSISESLGIDGNAQLDFNYEASITDNVGSRSFDRVSIFVLARSAGLIAKFFDGDFRSTLSSGNITNFPLPLSATSNSVITDGGSGRHVRTSINYTSLGELYGFIAIGYFTPPTNGNYYFRTASDDGSGVWVDTLALEGQTRTSANANVNNGLGSGHGVLTATSGPIALLAGTAYPIRIVHEEGNGGDSLIFSWSSDGTNFSTDLSQHFTHATSDGIPTGNF